MAARKTPAQLKRWFDSDEFEKQYHCDAPLGVTLDAAQTRFALWAPTAQTVRLNLYADGAVGAPLRSITMQAGERGLWLHEEPASLSGLYYDYDVTVEGETRRTQDPYAKACGVNGLRGMVASPAEADPAGWAADKAPAKPVETVVYELHVKDFSWDVHSGVPEKLRGKYAALTLTDTTLDGAGVHPTCLNHVRRLGATHVQLLPVYDYGSVDEAGDPAQFNWGYDPVNYNVPEGSYASDPADGLVRIRELKQAVMALHKAGFRVIMDVVYNHTYHLKESCLFKAVPWYYYRQNADGSASNGSRCGSEIASERSMVSRYILDSVMYWAEEYHMDGFRFDLMGMLDVPLMNRIQQALDDRFGPGEKQIWGEPWAGGECHPIPGTALAHKAHMRRLSPAIGAFCDDTRDAVKGSVMDEMSRGFVNGGGLSAERLACCALGWAGDCGDFARPSQTITYLSSHDDWTLWDKLVSTLDPKRDFTGCGEKVLRANRLAFAILAGCQGHLFMLSGEEFGRTKQGVKNSYRSPLSINAMDWQRSCKNAALTDYYRGLIALRKRLSALTDKSANAGGRLICVRQLAQDAAALLLDNGPEGSWPQLLLAFNASDAAVEFNLPAGEWAVLADGESSFLWQKPASLSGRATLPPMSAMYLGLVK